MATHDYVLSNQSGSSFRTDLNNALAAIVTNNSSSSAPTTTYSYMVWTDSNNNLIKLRNAANDAWITIADTSGGVNANSASTFNSDVTFDGATAGRDMVWDRSQNALEFADNAQCAFGSSNDLVIKHDSTNSIINNDTGDLYIQTDNNLKFEKKDGGEDFIHCIADGAVELHYDGNMRVKTGSDRVTIYQHLYPGTDNLYDLGDGSNRWDDVWATNGTIQTSDVNQKDNITATDLGLTFVDKLTPKSYKFKGKTRTHYGLIAQDVEAVLSDISKSASDFAGFIKDKDSDNNDIYGLRYTEFIAPLIKAIQELSAKVTALEAK
tara:strand:+ start:4984 stop:5949 length:966 start_codon:yes stop_codon:yes gene_type:complete